MKKLLIVFVMSIFQQFTFANQIMFPDTAILRIDPENASGGTCGNIYSAITFIPLENSKQCIIGEVSKLEIVDKYFIVFDRGTDQIVIFNKDGSFHAKCANIPGLQKSANMDNFNFNVFGDFAIKRGKKQIIVRTNLDRENLYIFNYSGDFIGKISLRNNNNMNRFWGFAYLSDNNLVYAVSPSSLPNDPLKTTGFQLHFSNELSSKVEHAIPYDPLKIAKGPEVQTTLDGPFYWPGTSKGYFFTRPYDYNIYTASGEGLSNIYKIVFPVSYSLPTDFLTNEEKYNANRGKYLNANRQNIYVLSNVYTQGNNLLFKINNNQFGDDNKIFSYNLKTESLLSLMKVSPDEFSYFLPVINLDNAIRACDGEYIYTSLSSLEMFAASNSTQDKKTNYPSVLKEYFATQSRKSNPVIIQLKLKANL